MSTDSNGNRLASVERDRLVDRTDSKHFWLHLMAFRDRSVSFVRLTGGQLVLFTIAATVSWVADRSVNRHGRPLSPSRLYARRVAASV